VLIGFVYILHIPELIFDLVLDLAGFTVPNVYTSLISKIQRLRKAWL